MFINRRLKEINLKIVYYGPALSGKTTNLQYIHAHIHPQTRGELVSLKTREDRTIFFDFLQLELGKIGGLKPRFSLYTVPGQAYYVVSRKLVLQGADGVVFVADSQCHRLADNQEDMARLERCLRQMGHRPEVFPLVLQCNKQDLPDVLHPTELKAHLGRNGVPCFTSVATQGVGVFDALKAIINQVVRELR
jgi:signal recognition particle receptor subunit beta